MVSEYISVKGRDINWDKRRERLEIMEIYSCL